jgi:hypothetical protein
LVLRITARSTHRWLRITAQSASDLRTTVNRPGQGFHPSLHRFRVITVLPPTSRCVVTVLSFSPAAAPIPTVLLTLRTLRENGHCSKLVFQLKHSEILNFIGGIVRSGWLLEMTADAETVG